MRACMMEELPDCPNFYRCAKCKRGFIHIEEINSGEFNYCQSAEGGF